MRDDDPAAAPAGRSLHRLLGGAPSGAGAIEDGSAAVVDALRAAGLEPVGPVPHPPGAAPEWSAVSLEGVRFHAVLAGADGVGASPGDRLERLRRRAEELAELRHEPGLARTARPVELDRGRVLLLTEDVPGGDLDALRESREEWRPGQVVSVVVAVGRALAVMHEAGIVHGRVRARTVVLRPDGRPVLTGLLPTQVPAVVTGDPAQDVRQLARIGLDLLGTGPVLGGDADDRRGRLRGVLEECERDLRAPDASALADAVLEVCRPEAVPGPEHALLAGAALRRLATAGDGRSRGARHGRHRRTGGHRGLLLRTTALLVVLGAAGGLTWAASRASAGVEDPAAAALRLTATRAQALGTADRDLLATVTVPGSPAAAADLALLERVGGVAPGSLEVDLRAAEVLEPAPAPDEAPGPGEADGSQGSSAVRVRVTSQVGASADDGTATKAAAPVRSVVLVLRMTAGQWRVHDVEAVEPRAAEAG